MNRKKIRLGVAALVGVFVACEVTCPTCGQLEEMRVQECERLHGPGAIVVGFQCGYASLEDPCGVVKNYGQCYINGAPQVIRETITPNF